VSVFILDPVAEVERKGVQKKLNTRQIWISNWNTVLRVAVKLYTGT